MKTITTKEAKNLIENGDKGRFFSVRFLPRNKDGKTVVNAKTKVNGKENGKGKPYSDGLEGLTTVWARNRDDFRSLPLEGIQEIRMNGEIYNVKPSKTTLQVGWGLKPLFGN